MSDDWRQLVERAAGGDADARNELVHTFYPRVHATVHRQLETDFRKQHRWMLPLFSTRDVAQDVFVGVIDRLGGAEFPDEEAFVAYLCTMVRNRLLDAVRFHEANKRDARREVAVEPDRGAPAMADTRAEVPEIAAMLAEQAEILNAVLGSFTERQRACLTMRMSDGESFPAIAEALGFASAETARQAFLDYQAKLLVRLRARGLRPPGETLI